MAKKIAVAKKSATQKTVEQPLKPVYELIDEQKVLTSKRFVKGFVQFPEPSEIFNPLLPVFAETKPLQIRLTADNSVKNGNVDGSENVAFRRVNLLATYELMEGVKFEVGYLVAFDLAKPVVKFYYGAKVSACLNLCVFGADNIITMPSMDAQALTTYLEIAAKKAARAKVVIEWMQKTIINPESIPACLGRMMLKTIEGNLPHGVNGVQSAVYLLTDKNSKYYMHQPDFTLWQFYNSFTEYFNETNKNSYFTVPEKVKDLFSLMADNYGFEKLPL